MEISDLIALLAFFLGIYGAVLSTTLALKENLKLKLEYLDSSYLTLSTNKEIINVYGEHLEKYNRNSFTIAILVRITNISKVPTTINEFILNNKYKFNSSFDMKYSLIPTSFKNYGSILIGNCVKPLEYKTITPLLQLNPLSSIEGYLIFSQLENIPSKFDITINAVPKSKTYHLKFDITKNYTNEIL